MKVPIDSADAAFRRVIRPLARRLIAAYGLREWEADDVLGDVACAAATGLRSYDIRALSAWTRKAVPSKVAGLLRDRMRRAKCEIPYDFEALEYPGVPCIGYACPANTEDPINDMVWRSLADEIRTQVDRLPSPDREVACHRLLGGRSNAETAAMLGLRPSTVSSAALRAVIKIKAALSGLGQRSEDLRATLE